MKDVADCFEDASINTMVLLLLLHSPNFFCAPENKPRSSPV